MSELAQALTGDSAFTPAAHILESLPDDLVHQTFPSAPHTIYQELWHLAFWQQITLNWIAGIETPYPTSPADAFPPTVPQPGAETWNHLRQRFLATAEQAAAAAQATDSLDQLIRCPSRPTEPVRTMTIRDQLISLASHNAYHLGRIVLLRQLLGTWPPPSGGFDW
ncbi:DinB family protein [Granulicella arctica]|uniref:Putative damage-inducible protein DinB n=1 Tax=Granulicella arctica TaxID=940613 RepID=A0A7Y9TF53_9BACT|nr:DinB family protein [Granulicella arctica]NYF78371.1 putative damage-inducible protein DinB [Granulicella arctica]